MALVSHIDDLELGDGSSISFSRGLSFWNNNRGNGDEKIWQKFFTQNPKILAQAIPNQVIQIGGKKFNNKGGNLIDFLYANKKTNNVVLVEIKTPLTALLGKKY